MAATLLDVCLLLLILIYTNALECDEEVVCLGLRPRGENGCCPLLKWEGCGNSRLRQCDEILGYSCINGICLGRFNLTAIDIGSSHVELTWDDFIPEGYLLEYSVMFTTKFGEDLQNWERHEFGIEPHVTLRFLDPDQWYFIRVGVWDDPELFTFLNITETLMVKTKALDHCLYYGSRVAVAETLVIECMESCTCLSTGMFRCSSVCPRGDTETPVCSDVTGPEEYCCEFVEHCGAVSNCSYQDDRFVHGESWLIDCLENCTCTDGTVTCYAVCGHLDPTHCLEGDFRISNDECCQKYLDCTKKDDLGSQPNTDAGSGNKQAIVKERNDSNHSDRTLGTTGNKPNKGSFSGTKAPARSEITNNETEVSFSVDKVSSTFAVLRWWVPYDSLLRNCTLVVKYRALSDPKWTYTQALQPNTTQCVVKCLKSSAWYMAELVSLEESKTIGITFFNTTKIKDTTDFQLRPKISTAEIKATAINIIWEPNMVWNNSDIVYTEVYWTKVYNSDESDVLQTCVDKYLSTVQIANLSPETMYVVWIGVILADSKVVYSNQLHFVTTTVPEPSTSFHEHSKIIAIAISCTSVVILFLTFISVVYIVKYRRRLSIRRTETSFENKIFQIH